MAALVQTYQQSGTTTILQARPNTSAGIMPSHSSHSSSSQPYMGHAHRNSYNGLAAPGGQQTYRGSSAPVQPYAFMSTPNLATTGSWQPQQQQQQQQQYGAYRGNPVTTANNVSRHNHSSSSANTPNGAMGSQSRPQSTAWGGSAGQPTFAQVAAAKASPERYRRPIPKTTDSSPSIVHQNSQMPGSGMPAGSGTATVVHLYNPRTVAADRKMDLPRNSAQLPARPQSMMGTSVDDMHVHRHHSEEDAKRFRRRSMHSIDLADYSTPPTPQELKQSSKAGNGGGLKKHASNDRDQKTIPRIVSPPAAEKGSGHVRNGSSESLVSSRSSNSRPSSSANRNSNASGVPTGSPASTSSNLGDKTAGQDQNKSLSVPPRGSSSDASKRMLNPSPLSKPVNMAAGSSSTSTSPAKPPTSSHGTSPAAQQLAAINEKGGKSKSKTSRLRRAFSFGSAAELKQVTGQTDEDQPKSQSTEAGKLHKEPDQEDLYEQEQQRIAQQQEESGIGSSIYSGTKLFSGSTDNLSISSTASSASIMLRKMGRGVKKSSRSLVGLFRPKSVIGAPIGDPAAPETSQPSVSMITVEAERERVNVNADPHSQAAGGTGFPKLERNSVDASKAEIQLPERLGSSGTDNSAARKSIVGGEKERAEVLATIRKGILKTSRSESPTPSARGDKGTAFELPTIPNVSESPNSSAPSTPNDDAPGHKRNSSIAIGNEDYFMSALRLRQDTKSAPSTPQGTMSKRNATFSPRIVFHDTWPSGEYDRRGEIATCNRLTPMLAQQIKEELNSFKMEMEVHETSKIYTHFF